MNIKQYRTVYDEDVTEIRFAKYTLELFVWPFAHGITKRPIFYGFPRSVYCLLFLNFQVILSED